VLYHLDRALRARYGAETGLKVPSVLRFDKLATLEKTVVSGKIGDATPAWLTTNGKLFFGVFGFDPPRS
jgi:mRNA interferase MazF